MRCIYILWIRQHGYCRKIKVIHRNSFCYKADRDPTECRIRQGYINANTTTPTSTTPTHSTLTPNTPTLISAFGQSIRLACGSLSVRISAATDCKNRKRQFHCNKCECHGQSEMTIINGYHVTQQVQQTKEPSLLNVHECRAYRSKFAVLHR